MNRIKYFGLLTIIFGSIILAGCSAKVYNVENKEIIQEVDTLKVKDTILKAGLSLGWSMYEVDNNTITASILLRGHSAITTISYTDRSYSINLIKADNLNYNKENNSIHKNYNSWIQNLEHTIDALLEPLLMNNTLIEKLKRHKRINYYKIKKINKKNIQNLVKLL